MCLTTLPGIGRAPVARSSARENGFTLPPPREAQRGLHGAERLDTKRDVLVERDAELFSALTDLVAVDAACERPVLELLLDGRDLEVRKALRGTHQRARDQKAAQLVDGEERFGQLRVPRHARIRGVPQHRAQQRLRDAFGAQQVDAPGGMAVSRRVLCVREFLVVKVVEQTDEPPRLRVLTELGGVSPHGSLDREHVLAQRSRLGVLVHQRQGFLAVHVIPTPQRSLHSASINCGHKRRA